jgi:V/A-type H+/Na+-transporting ATPase subunit E
MEVQLQELITKIKNDGVKVGESEKSRIIAEAEKKASAIIKAAEQKAKELEESAKEQAILSENRSREALQLASRDLILNLSTKITALFDEILLKQSQGALDQKKVSQLVSNAISHLGTDGKYEITLSEADAAAFGEALKAELSNVAKAGITIKPSKGIDAGFKITNVDDAISYDFSNAVIAENLAAYVNPKLAEDIKKSVGLS